MTDSTSTSTSAKTVTLARARTAPAIGMPPTLGTDTPTQAFRPVTYDPTILRRPASREMMKALMVTKRVAILAAVEKHPALAGISSITTGTAILGVPCNDGSVELHLYIPTSHALADWIGNLQRVAESLSTTSVASHVVKLPAGQPLHGFTEIGNVSTSKEIRPRTVLYTGF